MATYIIPFWQELHCKLQVEAESLLEAMDRFDAEGEGCGILLESNLCETDEIDTEGVVLYNAANHAAEVAAYAEISVEELAIQYGA